MRTNEDEIVIRVPGSIANIGPGFDTLAVAVQLYLTLRVRMKPGKGELRFRVRESTAGRRELYRARVSLYRRAPQLSTSLFRREGGERYSDEGRTGQQRRRYRGRPALV